MTAGQHEADRTTHPPPLNLSRECQRELAMLVANLIETHLSIEDAFDAELDAGPADQPDSSSNCFNPDHVTIKEDCHAHHRSTFD